MKRLLMLAASLVLLGPAFAQNTPQLDFTMVPSGGWPLCDTVPGVPCPLPGQEPWLFSVFTNAGPEVVGFQAIITFLPKDGVDGDPLQTTTIAFARNDQPNGTNADGTPLIYTAHAEPLGRIQPKTLTINALVVSFGKTATFLPASAPQSKPRVARNVRPSVSAKVEWRRGGDSNPR